MGDRSNIERSIDAKYRMLLCCFTGFPLAAKKGMSQRGKRRNSGWIGYEGQVRMAFLRPEAEGWNSELFILAGR
jgi:hypothetical protein